MNTKIRMAQQLCWPLVIIDDDGNAQQVSSSAPASRGRKRRADLVENEPGLCDVMEDSMRRAKEILALTPSVGSGTDSIASNSTVPDLAAQVRAQEIIRFPLRTVTLRTDRRAVLCAPLLFAAFIVNECEEDEEGTADCFLDALGALWRLPPRSAFCLAQSRRWKELGVLRPAGGYKLILLDPPWHSRSVQRARCYETSDRRDLLAELGPAIDALACKSGCVLLCWVTNNVRVQAFVEESLFARCGATPIARWYWAKLAADGSWAHPGADPHSPHRKPWEPLLIGLIGTDGACGDKSSRGGEGTGQFGGRDGRLCNVFDADSLRLPERLVVCSVPRRHSAKPNLDRLLAPAAPALLGDPDLPPDEAWRRLAKFEGFARSVRPGWHAAGNEVLHGNAMHHNQSELAKS